MKRLFRTYLSVVLLLCLVIQLVPLNLMHSHDDHSADVEHCINSIHDDADYSDGAEYVDDAHHESSSDDCGICKVQQSLSNQAYTATNQRSVFNFANKVETCLDVNDSLNDYLIKRTSGRAPPLV